MSKKYLLHYGKDKKYNELRQVYYKMEHHKISRLLSDLIVSKFVTRKWVEVKDLSNDQNFIDQNIKLRSNLCDYSDACIVVKGTIDLLAAAANKNDKAQKGVASKNNAPLRLCISEIYNLLIHNAQDLDIVNVCSQYMPMYNLLENSDNYYMKLENLWNYFRYEIDGVNDNASQGKSCE